MAEDDALKGDPEIQSGTEEPDPVNTVPTKDDEGNVGDGTGEGAATGSATGSNPNTGNPDL